MNRDTDDFPKIEYYVKCYSLNHNEDSIIMIKSGFYGDILINAVMDYAVVMVSENEPEQSFTANGVKKICKKERKEKTLSYLLFPLIFNSIMIPKTNMQSGGTETAKKHA